MTDKSPRRPPPFSLRLTPEERQALDVRAAGQPLGSYIRACLFGSNGEKAASPARSRGRAPVADQKALAQVLAKLGQSRLASNINQLARAANIGALPLTQETESALRRACEDIAAIKRMLMQALGIRER